MPTHALPSTAFRSCRNKLNSALRMPLFFPVLDKIKGSIPHSRIPYGLCGKFMVAASFFLLLALGLGAQDLKLKVAAYMKAQVEVNHFKGEILIAQKGMVLVRDQYGPVTGVSEEPTRHNKYPLGSIAKQFIAAAILQLQEKGKLHLHDSVCTYIPKCPIGWAEIRILNLLVQTDGIRDPRRFPNSETSRSANGVEALPDSLADESLEFSPGAKFQYSNSGYAVLAAVIEKVSGEPYRTYLKNHIFIPLGMYDTGYDTTQEVSNGGAAHGGNSITPNDLESAAAYSWGRVYSTVDDLYRWDRALDGEDLLSVASRNAMFTPYIDGYGLGWAIMKEFERRIDTQAEGIVLFGSAIRRYPDDDVCVIVLSNSDNADAGRISRDLAANLFGKHYELPAEHVAIHVDAAVYDSYVGKYELTPDCIFVVSREGNRLMIQGPARAAIEIVPESDTRFFVRGFDVSVNFVKDSNGKASQLVLQQGGRDIAVRRIG
jgi:CubicO group peptidase (beta-lactamase class C family)